MKQLLKWKTENMYLERQHTRSSLKLRRNNDLFQNWLSAELQLSTCACNVMIFTFYDPFSLVVKKVKKPCYSHVSVSDEYCPRRDM